MIKKNRGRGIAINGKKGIIHEMFFNIFEIVLAFIVILALFNFVNDIVKQTIFEKNYLARDLAVLTNTIYAAPGELIYNYNENVKEFEFSFGFKPNNIEIYENIKKQKELAAIVTYPFAEDKTIPFGYKIIYNDKGSVKIQFIKSKEGIDVEKFPNINDPRSPVTKNENK